MDSVSNTTDDSARSDTPSTSVSDPSSSRTKGCLSTSSSVVMVSQQANESPGVRRIPDRNDSGRCVRSRPDDISDDDDDGDDGDNDDDDDDDYRYESDSEPEGGYYTDGEHGDGNWHACDSGPDD